MVAVGIAETRAANFGQKENDYCKACRDADDAGIIDLGLSARTPVFSP